MNAFANDEFLNDNALKKPTTVSSPELKTEPGGDAHAMLTLVNSIQAELGVTGRYRKLPTVSSSIVEVLAHKRLVMVDDRAEQLAHWSPDLVVATEGCAQVVWHRGQSRTELIDAIIEKKPEVILLDYELACHICGSELIADLKTKLPSCVIIGFSAEDRNNMKLEQSGAHASVVKSTTDIEVLSKIAHAVEQHIALSPPSEPAVRAPHAVAIEAGFEERYGDSYVEMIKRLLSSFGRLRETAPEFSSASYSEEEARELGSQKLLQELKRITQHCKTPFEQFMVLTSDLCYYDAELSSSVHLPDEFYAGQIACLNLLRFCFSESLERAVADYLVVSSATNGYDFALLFDERDIGRRRLVTNSDLIELTGVGGYKYLDISPDGRPFVRCRTDRGGGRAFFDGERLMSHPDFKTCAPKVSFFKAGYIVNSTNCTIVNGLLYPLINEVDEVAHTTGATNRVATFSRSQALKSYSQNDELASLLRVDEEGVIRLPHRSVKPFGLFKPSAQRTLNDGFVHFDWSEFCPMS